MRSGGNRSSRAIVLMWCATTLIFLSSMTRLLMSGLDGWVVLGVVSSGLIATLLLVVLLLRDIRASRER